MFSGALGANVLSRAGGTVAHNPPPQKVYIIIFINPGIVSGGGERREEAEHDGSPESGQNSH